MSVTIEDFEYFPEDELSGYPVEGPECEEEDCHEVYTVACWLPDNRTDQPDYHYCSEHAGRQGFCKGCGDFWGGIESFEVGPYRGYCDNCSLELRRQDELDDYDSDYDDLDYWAGDVPDIHDEKVLVTENR